MKLNKKETVAYINSMPVVSFKNEHGEQFNIHSNGISVFISGDEVQAMVDPRKTISGFLPLFNSDFSILSAGELNQLGAALQELMLKVNQEGSAQ